MAQAVGRAALALPVFLETGICQNLVEEHGLPRREQAVGRLWRDALLHAFEGDHCAARAFAVADAPLSSNRDFQNALVAVPVVHDLHVPIFQA